MSPLHIAGSGGLRRVPPRIPAAVVPCAKAGTPARLTERKHKSRWKVARLRGTKIMRCLRDPHLLPARTGLCAYVRMGVASLAELPRLASVGRGLCWEVR